MFEPKSRLAWIYSDQGRWKEAEELQIQVIQTTKKVPGEVCLSTLISIGNLASTYQAKGCWKEAEEHSSTLTSMNNLAEVLSNQGKCEEVEGIHRQTLALREAVLGTEHPDTLTSMYNLAYTMKLQSRNEEAVPLMKRCF